jgi:tripartite ATP-independent transporter DctM subunit
VAIDETLKILLIGAVIGELGVVFFNILSRSLLGVSLVWTIEAAELALSMIAFLGGALAYRRGEHAFISTIINSFPEVYRRACYALVEFLVLTVAVVAAVNSIPFLIAGWEEFTPVLQMRVTWLSVPLLLGMMILAITAIERLAAQHRPTVLTVGAIVSACVLLIILTYGVWHPWMSGNMLLSIAVGLFLVTVLIGLPVGFALFLGALVYVYGSGSLPMTALIHTAVNGIGSFVLLAIPFFILAGVIMNDGGISMRLVRFVQTLVGHFRGGLLQVMVVSMYVVSGLSGSKAADVAAVGSVMRDMLRKEGYRLEQATAVLAASAAMGETVPPSIAMLVLGSVTTLSIGALFIAGLIPAAVIAVFIMLLIYLKSRRLKSAPRASLGQIGKAGLGSVLPLIMAVILFGGIIFGVAAPTEVSSFAVIYGLILSMFVYRQLGFRQFVRGIINCAAGSGMILFILAAASSFSWVLTVAQLPQRLVELMAGTHGSHTLFMLASILLLIVAGAILEGLPSLIVLAPILMPIASKVGVSELHYGIVLIIAMGIGAFMPPVSVGYYVTCAVCQTTIEKSGREMIPFIAILIVGLLVVALVPWFTLYLPAKFHLAG